MEEENQRPKDMTPETWALVEDLFPRSLNRNSAHPHLPSHSGHASDMATYDGSEAATSDGDQSYSVVDGISSTSETPSLLTPPLTNTDDEEFEDIEDEYEDEDGSSVATPSGWGSTPAHSVDHEYDQEVYDHDEYEDESEESEEGEEAPEEESEDERNYVQSRGVDWPESTSNPAQFDRVEQQNNHDRVSRPHPCSDATHIFDEPESYDDHETNEEMSGVRSREAPANTSPQNTPSHLAPAHADVLRRAIETITQQNEMISALSRSRPGYTQPGAVPGQEKPKKKEGKQKLPRSQGFSNKLAQLMEEYPDLFHVLVLVILSLVATALTFPYIDTCLGISTQVQEGAVTGRVQTIITPVATPVICAKTPVVSTSPEGVQYFESHSRVPQNMDDFITQLTCAKAQGMSESDDVQVHVVGDHHMVVRLPNRLVSVRDGNKFDIKVTRENNGLPFDLYKLFDGVFTLRLAPEDAYGPMNITVSALSKPKLTKVTGVDFGTPWLKIASWKRATQSLSQTLRGDLADAQTGLSKVYIKLTFDFRSMYNAWGMYTNKTSADATNNRISSIFDRAVSRAKTSVARSKEASDGFFNKTKESLRQSSDQLKAEARLMRRKARKSASSMMSAAQERAQQLRAPAFSFDLKAKFRDLRKNFAAST
ncbi:TPA_exp: Uncharacterized protein A8136_0401 [Trichophyton benhamiae CBS 112371]|uniref:Uncharacterized protein n=1 Tax=Arthroderma benhamiae (strain ATCC MYA-4681 / CBS 112371) TaxID=663331 RepID=D4AJE6_ARTBC|nr:uncharacterized protein ARB_04396 [Trichophyton benhamiae CBS 112371]EFE36869.1 conserved hypothetical protein [Trichophyton benhamiae CBS 112371]DAA79628.1 TPA_exp: Uncharacterized protein A8136_0401 [Trichophyton benhamiae CBS 112371]